MPLVIRSNSVEADTYELVNDGEGSSSEWVLLPLEAYLEQADNSADNIGVWLKSSDQIDALEPYISKLSVIACKFEAFADGRSFSQARALRDRYDYRGELRACGGFIQDQLFYLMRCGFDAFVVEDNYDIEAARVSLADFTESYQAACDVSEPLFRRRA
ncbi:MAG: hypothetical protein ACI93R_000553 [Flavobacteriales bacterium]|jgi:uncharacterized protein (DUF934 family)